mmetsp:Transcript_2836/g.7873  ORF Transcript_2836/g.7873 Transcript_2836/m.7873 type:complete len:254 (-) Transcript_2836:20-781(-)
MRTAWKGSIFANSNTVLSERGRNGFEICWQRKIHSYETRTRRGRVIFSVADLYGIKCKNRVAHQIVKSCHRGRALHGVRVCMNVSEENGARSARRGIVVCDDLCLEREREREYSARRVRGYTTDNCPLLSSSSAQRVWTEDEGLPRLRPHSTVVSIQRVCSLRMECLRWLLFHYFVGGFDVKMCAYRVRYEPQQVVTSLGSSRLERITGSIRDWNAVKRVDFQIFCAMMTFDKNPRRDQKSSTHRACANASWS